MRLLSCCAVLAVLAGCAAQRAGLPADVPVGTLTIRWQRLVDASDKTCGRCSSTEQEVRKAYDHLQRLLAPAGLRVELETERMDEAAFRQAPLESNKIWIDGRLLEEWLGGQSSSSTCGGCCGDDTQCRTVAVGGQTYEAIPAALIVRAAVLAAGDALRRGDRPAEGGQLVPAGSVQP